MWSHKNPGIRCYYGGGHVLDKRLEPYRRLLANQIGELISAAIASITILGKRFL